MTLALAGPGIATEEVFAAALGIAAALLLVGTSFLLRWQRNRQRFDLMRLAFENGATQFPKGPPYWLISLREAVTTLTLGIGLLVTGGGSYFLGSRVPPPTNEEIRAAQQQQLQQPPPPQAGELDPQRPLPRRGPLEGGPEERRPMAPQPPMPNPVLDRYHRAQSMQTIGLLAIGCGIVLFLLGLVRVAFARVERDHAEQNPPSET